MLSRANIFFNELLIYTANIIELHFSIFPVECHTFNYDQTTMICALLWNIFPGIYDVGTSSVKHL